MLDYRVRGVFRVQGKAWTEAFVWDPGIGLGRAICFELRATLSPSRWLLVQGEAQVLDQSSSAN